MAKLQGTVEELGMSIFMQGSHQLLDDRGQRIALLESASPTLDLGAYLGKKVQIEGETSPSVEGGATFCSVTSVTPV